MNPQPRLWDITLLQDQRHYGFFYLCATDSNGFRMTTLANNLDSHLIRLHDLQIPAESILAMHAEACDTNSRLPETVITVGQFSVSPAALDAYGFQMGLLTS
jgi:hypothetical protein